jgi:hypothetical protein
MISNQKINKSNLEKITPENITQDLYQFIMMDWKSTSLVALRKNKSSKKLKNCIGDVVGYGMKKSEFWYSSIIPELTERIVDEKQKELSYKNLGESFEFQTLEKLKTKINEIYETEKEFQSEEKVSFFKGLVIDEINSKYMYMEQLRPNYWEQFLKDYYPEKGVDVYKENYEEKRRKAFKGLSFSEIEETQFYNNVALPYVAKKYQENVPRINVLTDASLDYTFKINVFKNTYLLTQKLFKLRGSEQPSETLFNEFNEFNEIMNYKPKMLSIENRYFEDKKKKDLTGILNKIKNKN